MKDDDSVVLIYKKDIVYIVHILYELSCISQHNHIYI